MLQKDSFIYILSSNITKVRKLVPGRCGPNILLVSVLRKDHAEYLRSAEMLGM